MGCRPARHPAAGAVRRRRAEDLARPAGGGRGPSATGLRPGVAWRAGPADRRPAGPAALPAAGGHDR